MGGPWSTMPPCQHCSPVSTVPRCWRLATRSCARSSSRTMARTACRWRASREVGKLVSGVTASRALIDAAIAAGADAILVHHGLFWRGQERLRHRLDEASAWQRLLAHDINLFAYHLPLDAHPTLGNNAQLGQRLGLRPPAASASRSWASSAIGRGAPAADARRWPHQVEHVLGRTCDAGRARRGSAAAGGLVQRRRAGLLRVRHRRRGAGLHHRRDLRAAGAPGARVRRGLLLACGHHATERYGAPAMAAHVAAQWASRTSSSRSTTRHERALAAGVVFQML
jgi:putative NIF3 family GTP cyclohydrolase 1 type 2